MITTTRSTRGRNLAGWSTRDMLVTAVISLVAGLASVAITPLWTIAYAAFGPLVGNALGGYIALIYLLAPIIVRRPLAALIGALICSLAQIPFSPYGFALVASGLIMGTLYELGYAITRYRSYRTRTIVIIAATVQLVGVFPSAGANGYLNLGIGLFATILVAAAISGAIGGWLATQLAAALARTGVLGGTAAGTEYTREI